MATKASKIKEVTDLLKGNLAERVESEKEEILEGLMTLAKGVYTMADEMQPDGKIKKVRVYSKLPDKEVAQYLLNQFIGKPKQNVEVSGDPDKPLIIQVAPEIAEKYKLAQPNVTSSPSTDSEGHPQV